MSIKSIRLLAGTFLAGVSLLAVAQTPNPANAPGGIQVGSGLLIPVLDTAVFHNDNLFNGISGSELSTMGFLVSPNLTYDLDNRTSRFVANWDMEAGFYDKSSRDDYVDNVLSALLEFMPTRRFDSSIRGEYRDTHDPRGTGRAEGVITGLDQDPDEWHSFSVDGTVGYGLASTRARVEANLGYVTKEYDNNLLSTAFRDRDDFLSAARFFYRLAPRTSVVLEGRYSTHEYDLASPITGTLDSQTYRALVGLDWETTAITTASLKIGYIEKKFDAPNREKGYAFNWEANLQWAPRTYSVFNFTTGRDFAETDGTGNFVQVDTYSVDWTHFWNNQVSTTADFAYMRDAFDPTTRKDNRVYAGLKLSYIMQRWLTLSGSYRYEDRSSNRDEFDYNGNVFMLMASFNL